VAEFHPIAIQPGDVVKVFSLPSFVFMGTVKLLQTAREAEQIRGASFQDGEHRGDQQTVPKAWDPKALRSARWSKLLLPSMNDRAPIGNGVCRAVECYNGLGLIAK
jgi:hypothetical protein